MDSKIWDQISPSAKSLVKRLLTVDYQQRPYAKEALQDEWFKSAPQKPIDPEILKQALGSMRSFNVSQKLQQATLCLMVNNLISTEEQNRLEKIFRSLDANGDGVLQYDELLSGMVEIYGEAVG